jgi:hypothetical protein
VIGFRYLKLLEDGVAVIALQAHLPSWIQPSAEIPWAGSFNPEKAKHWEIKVLGDGERDIPEPDESAAGWSAGRIWLLPSGRWAMTLNGCNSGCYLTPDEAREILAGQEGGYEVAMQYIDRPRNREGRPSVGPEVKMRLPGSCIARVDELAAINGLTRAGQLRALVLDSLP